MTVPYLRTQNNIVRGACFLAFAYFSLGQPISLFAFGYLLLLLGMLALTSTPGRPPWSVTKGAWYLAATYTLLVVLAGYMYQFEPIEAALGALLRGAWLTPAVVGLRQFPSLIQVPCAAGDGPRRSLALWDKGGGCSGPALSPSFFFFFQT